MQREKSSSCGVSYETMTRMQREKSSSCGVLPGTKIAFLTGTNKTRDFRPRHYGVLAARPDLTVTKARLIPAVALVEQVHGRFRLRVAERSEYLAATASSHLHKLGG
eukprot:scaffold21887_cov114-Isochrysis_galbana.AAC.2